MNQIHYPPSLRLIVGLCNPGVTYAKTRHNAGSWIIERLCREFAVSLNKETKFQGWLGTGTLWNIPNQQLFLPTTYMNRCGSAVRAIAQYYHIPTNQILVIHDELDLSPGIARIKCGGGHGGHNGLRDILSHLQADFTRLRIGIGHPGHKQDVSEYVLAPPTTNERKQIDEAIEHILTAFPWMLKGEWQKAIQYLHSINE